MSLPDPLRRRVLATARSVRVRGAFERTRLGPALARRWVVGPGREQALELAEELLAADLAVTLAPLDADEDPRTLLAELQRRGHRYHLAVQLPAATVARDPDLARLARAAGTPLVLDATGRDGTSTQAALDLLAELRKEYPGTAVLLAADLHRTEDDCRQLAHEGSRVVLSAVAPRLSGGEEPWFTDPHEADRSAVRCLKVLMAGSGHPVLASEDPRLVRVAVSLAGRHSRRPGTYEFRMVRGGRPDEQRRLAAIGESVRVLVPYGQQWYGHLLTELAEHPRPWASVLASLVPRN